MEGLLGQDPVDFRRLFCLEYRRGDISLRVVALYLISRLH